MKDIIQSIKSFLLDIQPKLVAIKDEVPTEPTVEEQIEQIGTLEVMEQVMEEVETLVELAEPLMEADMTPSEIGLSEVKVDSEVEILKTELELSKSELDKTKLELANLQTELAELRASEKQSFSLSAVKGKASNLTEKQYLRQLLNKTK